ncbi:MAG: hypothetical protein PHX30_03910 [Candidatus Pacebacteria bacterium]|nr:hypothetical protein [Candidatus Paceibacterota bacterium]
MNMKDIFINYDGLEKFRQQNEVKVAVIARPDWFMKDAKISHLIVETESGIHNRCYLTEYEGISFIIVYGRFDRVRGLSSDINYELTQETLSALGIETIIGTFVGGSIKDEDFAGNIYIPHDFFGMGNYSQSRNRQKGFRNVDMYEPFCAEARGALVRAADNVDYPVKREGVYVCFHGYPRIETKAELDFYKRMGWDIVGQTLDPEATLAKEAGCHYAALAGAIDDRALRQKFMDNDPTAKDEIEQNIIGVRRKTFEIFLHALPSLVRSGFECNCEQQKKHIGQQNYKFYYMPRYLVE